MMHPLVINFSLLDLLWFVVYVYTGISQYIFHKCKRKLNTCLNIFIKHDTQEEFCTKILPNMRKNINLKKLIFIEEAKFKSKHF